jgi:hypothetical protein
MKIFKTSAPIETKLQELEATMRRLGLTIDWDGEQLNVSDGNHIGYLHDVKSNYNLTGLPRELDGERIVFDE